MSQPGYDYRLRQKALSRFPCEVIVQRRSPEQGTLICNWFADRDLSMDLSDGDWFVMSEGESWEVGFYRVFTMDRDVAMMFKLSMV